jgi:hypothetical protein
MRRFRVGGKTGSAEKPGAGGYRRTSLISTFAAAFPMDKPRFVVVTMLDEPRGTVASSFSAPRPGTPRRSSAGWCRASARCSACSPTKRAMSIFPISAR